MRVLNIQNTDELHKVAKALSLDVRVKIFELLYDGPLNNNQISKALDIPSSTTSVNLKKLEEAGLIETKMVPAKKRGLQKISSLKYNKIVFEKPQKEPAEIITEMPIGHFTKFEVNNPCGLASEEKVIGKFDYIPSFYLPAKTDAQLIWFSSGFLEYHFPNELPEGVNLRSLEISAELCSEAKGYNNSYLSDISLWINDIEIDNWTSPGDFGGKRGKMTPDWWHLSRTQYGILKRWLITEKGIFRDKTKVKKISISDLHIDSSPSIKIRIGVKPDAENKGGLNLFGAKFGNFAQDLRMKIKYLP